MTNHQDSHGLHDLEPRLAKAVQAVRSEILPDGAVSRVIDRARQLDLRFSGRAPLASASPTTVPVRSAGRLLAWGASGACAVAVAVLLALFLFSGGTRVSFAGMLAALESRPWVHAVTTYSDGKQSATSESWVSTELRCAAAKFGTRRDFIDLATGTSLQYDAQDETIYRLPYLHQGEARAAEGQLPGLLDRLIADKADSRELFHGERVVKAERHEEEQNGKQWLDYLIHLERIENPTLTRTVRIRLDRATQLPASWDERQANGDVAKTRFDYPDNGPRDIYELGVPKTAPLVDRVPKDDLTRIIAADRAGRQRFESYDAIVVQSTEGAPTSYDYLQNLAVRRVRRKAGQYRVDALLCAKEGLAAPAPGADMQQWWTENRDRYWSVPMLICDGETTHFYKLLDDRIVPGKNPNLAVVQSMQIPIRTPTDDPPVDWPHLMPEQCCRPHLWPSVKSEEIAVDSEAKDGPPGTVRVVVTEKTEPRAGEVYRYWFDPARDYTLRKQIARVFDSRTNKLAYLDTQQYDEFAQSPSGIWYPRLVRRSTSDGPWQGVTRFYVDFSADFADDLFRPVPEP